MPKDDGTAAVRAAVLRIRRAGQLPVAMAAMAAGGSMFRVGELSGVVTDSLDGLAVAAGNGLGGKAATTARPLSVSDYPTSRLITHEYDVAVQREGLRSVLAVPVIVRCQVRAVLYGGLRVPAALEDRALTVAVDAAREVERRLLMCDEAERLLSVARQPAQPVGRAAWEEVREVHGALRTLADRVPDPLLRDELLLACGRLAAASPERERVGRACWPVELSPRETDVLTCVASGATNAQAADRLGVRPETVKSYLRSSMRKLGAHTRVQAVVAARRVGALP